MTRRTRRRTRRITLDDGRVLLCDSSGRWWLTRGRAPAAGSQLAALPPGLKLRIGPGEARMLCERAGILTADVPSQPPAAAD